MKRRNDNLNKIRKLLGDLNCAELATLASEIEVMAPHARQPSPEEALLPPGHYFEERVVTTGPNALHYLYQRWYERDGRQLKHKGKMLHKGTLAEYVTGLKEE